MRWTRGVVWGVCCWLAATVAGAAVDVATWNLEYFDNRTADNSTYGSGAGPRPQPQSNQLLAKLIMGQMPGLGGMDLEVIGLQEVTSEEALRALVQELPGWRYQLAARRQGDMRCALLWDTNEVSVQPQPDVPLGELGRYGLHARLRVDQFDWDYLVVHLKSGNSEGARRLRECQDILAWLHSTGPGAPTDPDVLVAGDMNCSIASQPLRLLMADGLLSWAFEGLSFPPTHYTHRGAETRIDHLFLTRSCLPRLQRAQVWQEPYEALGRDEYFRYISDHLPLVATFRTD